MCVIEERGRKAADVEGCEWMKMRRWVVRIKTEDLMRGSRS